MLLQNDTLIMSARRKALPEIIALNVLLCLQVIFIHVSSAQVTSFINGNMVWGVVFVPWRLLTINVRGFIFLSGLKMFYSKKEQLDYGRFYSARLLKIVVPYLLWNIVYYLYFISIGYFDFSAGDLLRYILDGSLVGPFYFVVIIVQFYALAPLWMKLIKRVNPLLMLVLATFLTLFLGQYLPDIIQLVRPGTSFLYNDRTFTTYLLFWVMGCYAGLYYDQCKRIILENKRFITVLFLCFTVLEASMSFISMSGIRQIGWLEPLHVFYNVTAILFLFTFFAGRYDTRTLKNKLVLALDKVTYQVFLAHVFVILLADRLMGNFGIAHNSILFLLRIVIVFPVTLGACLLWGYIKQKVKAFVKNRKTA